MELRSRHSLPSAAEPDCDSDEAHARNLDGAMRALETLPERHRMVIRLRLLAGLEGAETASVLGCPVEQVRVRLHRALELLRSRLSTANAALLPVTALEETLRTATTPPVALSSSAHHCALNAFTAATLPVTTGITLGALMAISTVGISLVATLALITTTFHAARAPAVQTNASSPPLALTASAPAPESSDDLASDILKASNAAEVVAYAIQNVALKQGVAGQPDAIYQAALTAAFADTALWHNAVAIMERHYSRETLLQMRTFLTSPAGTAYMRFQPHLQLALNAGAMQDSFQQVISTTMMILAHTQTPLAAGAVLDPQLACARSVSLASGYAVVVTDQIAEAVCRMAPAQSRLAVYAALDRALAARPTWMDPLLKIYAAQLTQAQMEAVFAFYLTTAGREQAALLPTVTEEGNVMIEAHFPRLVAVTRALLAAAPAGRPAATASPTGF